MVSLIVDVRTLTFLSISFNRLLVATTNHLAMKEIAPGRLRFVSRSRSKEIAGT